MNNWIVRVYKEDTDTQVAEWVIKDRTEQQASKEAMHEVEHHWSECDWSLTKA